MCTYHRYDLLFIVRALFFYRKPIIDIIPIQALAPLCPSYWSNVISIDIVSQILTQPDAPCVRLQNLPWYKTGLVSRQVLHLLSKLQNWIFCKTGRYKTGLVSNTKIEASIGLLNPNPDSHTLPLTQSKYLFKMKRQVSCRCKAGLGAGTKPVLVQQV